MSRAATCGILAGALLAAACGTDTPLEPGADGELPTVAQARLAAALSLSVMTGHPACDVAATAVGDDWMVPKQTSVCLEPAVSNGSEPVDRGTFVIQQCATSTSRVSKSMCESREARWRTIRRVRCCDGPGSVMTTVPFVPTGGANGYLIRYIAQGSGVSNGVIGPFDLVASD